MLNASRTVVKEERSTRKAPMSEEEAAALLAGVETVVLAKGKKAETRPARDLTVADLKGPTGNIRAPLVRRGRTLLVGFHPESLQALL